MLINSKDGTLQLEAFATQLYKGMLLDQLQQTEFYKKKYHHMWDVKTGYVWYYFDKMEVRGYQFCLNLCFLEDQLHSIHMNTWESTDAKDWNEWTEQKEMQVFRQNNTFLEMILEVSPTKKKTPYPSCTFQFPWGDIWSVYDPRSASSLMGISYNEEENN
ncbi:hypothetical protein [Chryseobacterium sp.]|uniref:hypothetical protein n=1 Tax=Chryseobacterium sp. TaxID=1871047 RepID=UPI002FC8822B